MLHTCSNLIKNAVFRPPNIGHHCQDIEAAPVTVSWSHLLSHRTGLVLAQLTRSLIPPCHSTAAVLQLHHSLDEDSLALLM